MQPLQLVSCFAGGKQKQDVPFTWVVKLKQVTPVCWEKQVLKQAAIASRVST